MPDPLDTLTVTVRSPDGNIEADVDRRFHVTLRPRPGALREYTELTLEHQLGQLSRLAWVAYQREYRAAIEAAGRVVNDWNPKRRAYREAMMRISVSAASDAGYIQASCDGLERWTFQIQAGTLAQLTEDKVVAEIESAVANAGTQFEHETVLLKDEYFRLDVPPQLRAVLDQLWQRSKR